MFAEKRWTTQLGSSCRCLDCVLSAILATIFEVGSYLFSQVSFRTHCYLKQHYFMTNLVWEACSCLQYCLDCMYSQCCTKHWHMRYPFLWCLLRWANAVTAATLFWFSISWCTPFCETIWSGHNIVYLPVHDAHRFVAPLGLREGMSSYCPVWTLWIITVMDLVSFTILGLHLFVTSLVAQREHDLTFQCLQFWMSLLCNRDGWCSLVNVFSYCYCMDKAAWLVLLGAVCRLQSFLKGCTLAGTLWHGYFFTCAWA